MVFADLHVHTENSDGELSLSAVPEAARAADVSVVGVTDHDRFHPDLDAPVVSRDGVTIVHGIELRVETPEQRVDLLAYGLSPTPPLREALDRLQRDRIDRARTICSCLEDRLGITLDVPLEAGVGRPHIARSVVAHPETDFERIDDVFSGLIGDGDPCYVARDVPDFQTGVDLLSGASALVGLAHPLRYRDPVAALERCASLDAVERYYPYDGQIGYETDVGPATVEEFVERYDLLITGGSDAHDTALGTAGLSREEYARIEDVLVSRS
ncbi:MAG: PHP domain-containing protein [Halodesulfurarchaeum sp.]